VTTQLRRTIGVLALLGLAATVWLGLWVTPPDAVQGNYARFLYIHPPLAWVAYLAYGLAAVSSVLYLVPRTRNLAFDRLAVSAVEVGVIYTLLTLLTGSLWGKNTWGVYWVWDARLTSTAFMAVLFLGYLALRRVPGEPHQVAKRSAVAALVAFIDVPIVHFSVQWWNTLHQGQTIQIQGNAVHGSMAWTLLLGFVSFTLAFVWMLMLRYQLERARSTAADSALAEAVAARRREGDLAATEVSA